MSHGNFRDWIRLRYNTPTFQNQRVERYRLINKLLCSQNLILILWLKVSPLKMRCLLQGSKSDRSCVYGAILCWIDWAWRDDSMKIVGAWFWAWEVVHLERFTPRSQERRTQNFVIEGSRGLQRVDLAALINSGQVSLRYNVSLARYVDLFDLRRLYFVCQSFGVLHQRFCRERRFGCSFSHW